MLKQQEQSVIAISASSGSTSDSGLAIKSSAEFWSAQDSVFFLGKWLIDADDSSFPRLLSCQCRPQDVTTLLTTCDSRGEVLHGNAAVTQQRHSQCLEGKLSARGSCGGGCQGPEMPLALGR